ncbi:hypothetical protein BGZ94_001504 [Podila epigama]|nr:hypothetical protein BGZ94_001504 [Podila epigama]
MPTPAVSLVRIALRQGQRHGLQQQHSHGHLRPRFTSIPRPQVAQSPLSKGASHRYSTRTHALGSGSVLNRPSRPTPPLSQLLCATPAAHLSLVPHTSQRYFHPHSQPEHEDVMSFYDDKVTQYANQEIQTITLKSLLGLGRSGSNEQGSSPHSLETNLQVARYARQELPVRLARLIKATQRLPFIVGTNPYIKNVYKLYYDSFQTITNSTEAQHIHTKDDLDKFANVLQGLVYSHADVVPMLSQGFQECKKYMSKADIKVFLDGMIHARIGIRLIAEQVISLREQRDHQVEDNDKEPSGRGGNNTKKEDFMVGVVHTGLKPAELIRTCASFVQELCDVNYGSSPEVIINGHTDAQITYVPVHLEYILCELLKNAVRATVEHSKKMGRSALNPFGESFHRTASTSFPASSQKSNRSTVVVDGDGSHVEDETKKMNEFGHPPVEVTIAQGDHEVTIRIRDQGGGISRENLDSIFDYSFTTVKQENENSLDAGEGDSPYGVDSIFKGVSRLAMQAGLGGPIAGLGFGLPLTRIYTQYFGGDMHLISLQGHGCDVFVKLKQIDETLDNIQI